MTRKAQQPNSQTAKQQAWLSPFFWLSWSFPRRRSRSCDSGSRALWIPACAGMTAVWLWSTAAIASISGIQSKAVQPICPRGSVLMLPLVADRPGDDWPSTLQISFGDDQTVVGQVAWVYEQSPQLERHWTDDPRGLGIRAVLPTDDSSQVVPSGITGPYLLARLPIDADGPLQLLKQTLTPVWRDIPAIESLQFTDAVPSSTDRGDRQMSFQRPRLPLSASPDRPDPVSPFEYWR